MLDRSLFMLKVLKGEGAEEGSLYKLKICSLVFWDTFVLNPPLLRTLTS